MKRSFALLALLIAASLALSACSPPPPLRSDKYLNDQSLISQTPCGAPCYQNITVGKTTYSDAVAKIKSNPLFSNVQTQDASQTQTAAASWATAGGEDCCQLTTDARGVVNALLIKLAPQITAAQVIKQFGTPDYVTGVDYSSTEVALALIFRKVGVVAWVATGDATSTLQETNPVVVSLYLNPDDFDNLLATATLKGWAGYQSYKAYQTGTPIVTPRVTVTPGS